MTIWLALLVRLISCEGWALVAISALPYSGYWYLAIVGGMLFDAHFHYNERYHDLLRKVVFVAATAGGFVFLYRMNHRFPSFDMREPAFWGLLAVNLFAFLVLAGTVHAWPKGWQTRIGKD